MASGSVTPGGMLATTEGVTSHSPVLELQARARDHALAERVDRLERSLARVHARIDGAMVTLVPPPEPNDPRGPRRPA